MPHIRITIEPINNNITKFPWVANGKQYLILKLTPPVVEFTSLALKNNGTWAIEVYALSKTVYNKMHASFSTDMRHNAHNRDAADNVDGRDNINEKPKINERKMSFILEKSLILVPTTQLLTCEETRLKNICLQPQNVDLCCIKKDIKDFNLVNNIVIGKASLLENARRTRTWKWSSSSLADCSQGSLDNLNLNESTLKTVYTHLLIKCNACPNSVYADSVQISGLHFLHLVGTPVSTFAKIVDTDEEFNSYMQKNSESSLFSTSDVETVCKGNIATMEFDPSSVKKPKSTYGIGTEYKGFCSINVRAQGAQRRFDLMLQARQKNKNRPLDCCLRSPSSTKSQSPLRSRSRSRSKSKSRSRSRSKSKSKSKSGAEGSDSLSNAINRSRRKNRTILEKNKSNKSKKFKKNNKSKKTQKNTQPEKIVKKETKNSKIKGVLSCNSNYRVKPLTQVANSSSNCDAKTIPPKNSEDKKRQRKKQKINSKKNVDKQPTLFDFDKTMKIIKPAASSQLETIKNKATVIPGARLLRSTKFLDKKI